MFAVGVHAPSQSSESVCVDPTTILLFGPFGVGLTKRFIATYTFLAGSNTALGKVSHSPPALALRLVQPVQCSPGLAHGDPRAFAAGHGTAAGDELPPSVRSVAIVSKYGEAIALRSKIQDDVVLVRPFDGDQAELRLVEAHTVA